MSDKVKLSAALPGNEEVNGLDAYADRLQREPDTVVAALCWFDVVKITETVDPDGHITRVPTVRVRKAEPIGESPETKQKASALYTELNEARLGMSPLPYDQLEGRTEHIEVLQPEDVQG